jgi:integrase
VKMDLSQAVDLYLHTRRRFGFALVQVGVELRSLARFARDNGHRGLLTTALVTQWAQHPQRCAPGYRVMRLKIARRLARFWHAYDPRVEIPAEITFGPNYRRRAVHIYSPQELALLGKASVALGRVHPLRASTFRTLVGLLVCTGLRIGEALQLSDADIDWSAGVLTIRRAKNGHTRLVPVQPSTVQSLQGYRQLRNQTIGSCPAPRFFVSFRGQPLGSSGVNATFRKLCRTLGWTQAPVPRLHDLRHTFAVRTLLGWYQKQEPIGPKLWVLSTYLGHRHLADTYWYLTAVPELMQLGLQRFARAQAWASGGVSHE